MVLLCHVVVPSYDDDEGDDYLQFAFFFEEEDMEKTMMLIIHHLIVLVRRKTMIHGCSSHIFFEENIIENLDLLAWCILIVHKGLSMSTQGS